MMFAHIRVCAPCIHLAQVKTNLAPCIHLAPLHPFGTCPAGHSLIGLRWADRMERPSWTITMTSWTIRSWMLNPSFCHLTVPVESRIAMATSSASHLVPGDLLLLRPFARLWSMRPRSYVEFHGDLFRHVVINGLPCSDKR